MASSTEVQKPNSGALARVWVVIGVSTALLIAVLGWAVALNLQTDSQEKLALKTPYAIIGVTVGTEPFVLGAGWQKIALGLNPKLAPRIGGTVLSCPSARPGCLVIWQHFNRARGWSGPPPMLAISCSDDLGHRMHEVASCNDFLEANGDYIFPFIVTNFPRRGRTVRLSARDISGQSAGSPISVPNPLPGPYPEW